METESKEQGWPPEKAPELKPSARQEWAFTLFSPPYGRSVEFIQNYLGYASKSSTYQAIAAARRQQGKKPLVAE